MVVTITFDLDDIWAIIIPLIERSDWIYNKFDEPGMSNAMVFNLTDVLGFLSGRYSGTASVYVHAMEARMQEAFRRSDYPRNFGWPDVRYIIGDSFEDGALKCFLEFFYNEPYSRDTRQMFARLVVCCLFCEKHAGPVGS